MRLSDLLTVHLEGVSRVFVQSTGELDLGHYLPLPDGVVLVRVADLAELTPAPAKGDLVAVLHGPDQRRHGDPALAETAASHVGSGARLLIASGYGPEEMPFHRLLDPFAAAAVQVLQVAPLTYDHVRVGVVAERVDGLPAPRDVSGRRLAGPDAETEIPQLLRVANEWAVDAFVLRRAQGRLADAETVVGALRAELAQATATAAQSGTATDTSAALQRQLRETQERLLRAESRVARLEASTSMEVGRLLVRTAKDPRRSPSLPRDVYRLWRDRAGPARRTTTAGRSGDPVRAIDAAATSAAGDVPLHDPEPFVSRSGVVIGHRDRLSVVGVVTARAAAALGSAAAVNATTPNDALAVLRRTSPDVLLIETAAADAPGGWAHLGDLVAPERDSALLELIEESRVLGIPVAVWDDVPRHRHPGLELLLRDADFRLGVGESGVGTGEWTHGVDLGRYSPVALGPAGTPVLWTGRLSGSASGRDLLTALDGTAGLGLVLRFSELAPDDPADLPPALQARAAPRLEAGHEPDAFRDAAVVLAEPWVAGIPVQVQEQLLSGARVVTWGNAASPRGLGSLVTVAAGPSDVPAAVRQSLELGRPGPAELRSLLRVALAEWSSRVMAARLARAAGASVDPLVSRGVAVVAPVADDDSADAVVRAALAQVLRPVEVLVTGPGGPCARAVTALAAEGIQASYGGAGGGEVAADARAAAVRLDAPWLRLWAVPPRSAHDLLDLVAGQECSGADAVGYGVEELCFVPSLTFPDALVRRSMVAAEGFGGPEPLAGWARRGRRLLSLRRLDGGSLAVEAGR